ncbi:uncharacterized protein LOC130687460 isoform X2 [Daphnia carinata]|uniref:uncharacterized protein LOC130687460 isoform X2 n=1 Tax=Daphnia carinata TaxID=120202 RepID=UPI00257AD50A|nr:uncharacterized protein LOC130687460 isoform X2 [Daphnia carinata]
MKLVHLIQSLLLGVVVLGRAIEEQTADTSVVTDDADQLPYRFRYNVANPISGDYKSQAESRDGDGVVTGLYKVLQPDADAMGFHPTVTYEGDCKRAGSIKKAGQAQSPDAAILSAEAIATPIRPSSAVVSSPIFSSMPGYISPPKTGGHVPARPDEDLSSPIVAAPSEKLVPVATTLSPTPAPSEIDRLWQTLGAQPLRSEITTTPGSVPALTSTENAVRIAVESEEIKGESQLPEALSTAIQLPAPVSKTPSDGVQSPAQQLAAGAPVAVPSALAGEVETSNVVPDSIVSLLQSFDPIQTVDTSAYQQSQFSERTLKTEPDSSAAMSPAVEDPAILNDIEVKSDEIEAELRDPTAVQVSAIQSDEAVPAEMAETAESKSIPQPEEEVKVDFDDDDFTLQTKVDETLEPKTAAQSDEKLTEKERSFGTFAHSALANVQNLTAPLTHLISSSVQNLSNPVTGLLNKLNKLAPTTVAPSTVSPVTTPTTSVAPAAKIDVETEDVAVEGITVTHDHNAEAYAPTDGVVPDLAAIAEDSQQLISERPSVEQVSSKEEGAEQTVNHNLESISVDVNDPAVLVESVPSTDFTRLSAEPALTSASDVPIASETIVYDSLPTVAEGDAFESFKLAGLEYQPTEQVQADVQDASSLYVRIPPEHEYAEADPVKVNEKSYYQNAETTVHHAAPESYARLVDSVPVIYSQLQTAPLYVHQQTLNVSPHAYPAPVRQSTARTVDSVAAMPYGARVHAFVPNYGTVGKAPPAYVYNQHRRQGQWKRRLHYLPHRRLVPAAPIRSSKKGEAYGMRYAAVPASPMKSRYAVRLPAVKQPTPFYSTYVY